MYSYKKDIGNLGENIAENYLIDRGYIILDRNFRSKTGEIDIIAKDGDYISFIEVKTRYGTLYGTPGESVNYLKQYRIYKTAQMYILKKRLNKFNFRFDVIEVILNHLNNDFSIKLIKDAFQV
ncbi:putative endonuclease [Clostridium pascui]|uniref:YraN family protein n=1 Tax=Clostridium pascui TaxID=46609 RepID=UPI0019578DD9|nr:YraN family protein [Clostridium pascui]MBM7868966.1 putative endonuclease [Clostridium pascui]